MTFRRRLAASCATGELAGSPVSIFSTCQGPGYTMVLEDPFV